MTIMQSEDGGLTITIPSALAKNLSLTVTEKILMADNQNTASQTIDSANAANSASSTTNTSHDQQTIQQQNNALFAQNLSQRDQMFDARMKLNAELDAAHVSKVLDSNTTSLMVVMGNITILP